MEPEENAYEVDLSPTSQQVDSGSLMETVISSDSPAFEILLGEPIRRPKQGALNAPYWAYKVTVKANLPQYTTRNLSNERRYSDFEWLRNKLTEEFPGLIVPPIPEKSLTGTMEKWFASGDTTPLLQYRRRALQLFLERVAEHPKLQQSNSLKEFFERKYEDLATLRKSDKPQTPRTRSSSSSWFSGIFGRSSSSSQVSSSASPSTSSSAPSSGSPATSAGSTADVSLQSDVSEMLDWIDPITTYITKFEKVMRQLKEKLSILVEHRKEMANSSEALSQAFQQVARLENNAEDSTLGDALSQLVSASKTIGQVGMDQASKEQELVVDMLTYYLGMCEAIKTVIEWFKGKVHSIRSLEKSIAQLQSEQERAAMERSSKLSEELQSKRTEEDKLREELARAEDAFQEDWKRFQQHKQRDMKRLVKAFVEVQTQFFGSAHQEWRQTIPSLDKVVHA